MSTVQLFRREQMNFERFDDNSAHRDRTSTRFLLRVFYPQSMVVSTFATGSSSGTAARSVLQHSDAG